MPEFHENDPLQDIKDGINRNSKDHTMEFDPEDIRTNSTLAAVCYIPILFILPFFLKPNSRFAKFHANQGVILFIADAILGVVKGMLWHVPIVTSLISGAIGLITLAYFLYGFINTLNGKAKELPFIGGIHLIQY